MAPEGKDRSNIPVNFLDSDGEDDSDAGADQVTDESSDDDDELTNAMDSEDDTTAGDDDVFELDDELGAVASGQGIHRRPRAKHGRSRSSGVSCHQGGVETTRR